MVEGQNTAVSITSAVTAASTYHSRLQKIVLSWNYADIKRECKQGKDKKKASLKKVINTFSGEDEYIGVFEPLLFEEVKAQIARDEEGTDGENSSDQQAMTASCEKANEFYSVRIAVRDIEGYSENDLLIVSKQKLHDNNTVGTHALAMVEGREGQGILKLRMFFDGEVNQLNPDTIKYSPRLKSMHDALQLEKKVVWVLKLTSLSTIMREYAALKSVGSLPFADIIFSPGARSMPLDSKSRRWNIPKRLMDHLENHHNDSQLQAIQACLSRSPIVLIQGPPGTGKTQTILGLIGAVMHATPAMMDSRAGNIMVQSRSELELDKKFQHWAKASPWIYSINPRDLIMPIDGDDGFFPTSGNEFKPEIVAAKRKHRVHILVCAPSNSALDEIVLRLLNTGIRDENGEIYCPSVVRVGLQAHHLVQSVSMDYLVNQRLSTMDKSTGPHGAGANRDTNRAAILDEAAIVCSTLSFSGSSIFSRMSRGFDVVIIDEAAQAVEPATLVPLAHGCRQVFMVGDPIQLPATVLSTKAEEFGYGISLFKRFQQAGYPVQMLKTQYRMHPEIREFPSKEFYSEALEDGEDVEHQTKRPWHEYRCFGPFSFFDINGKETQPLGSGSYINTDEAEWVLLLYRHLASKYPELSAGDKVAVISPYKQQVKHIRDKLKDVLGAEAAKLIDVNTIDGFQGREKDVAIFSCVRANSGKGIGFVSDYRRMNVGITRARASMLVVGSASTLMQDKHWSNLVKSAKDRNQLFKVSRPFPSFFSEENLATLRVVAGTAEVKREDNVEVVASADLQMADAGETGGADEEIRDDDMVDDDGGGYDDMED